MNFIKMKKALNDCETNKRTTEGFVGEKLTIDKY